MKTPTTKTLTSGSYQIKDDGNYTVTLNLKNGDKITKTFLLKNGYDFSQGINATTWNPSANDPKSGYLNIYLNENFANDLKKNFYEDPGTQGLLTYLTYKIVKSVLWTDLVSDKKLNISIENLLGKGFDDYFNKLDFALIRPKGGDFGNYQYALQNKITKLNPTKGLLFHIHLNGYTWDNFPTPTKSTQPNKANNYQTNYWDESLFNQN